MKLIRHLTWQSMRSNKTRTLVTILGILLSASMFTAVTTMAVSFRAYMIAAEIAANGDYFVRYDYGTMEDLEQLRQNPLVTKLGSAKTLGYADFDISTDRQTVEDTLIVAAGSREFFEMVPVHLLEGRLPESGSELLLTGRAQKYLELSGQPFEIGQQITLPIAVSYEDENLELPAGTTPYKKSYTIVGITEYVQYFDDSNLDLSSLLTFDDGSTEGLWGRFFVKTAPKDAYALAQQQYSPVVSVNQDLLNLYGMTKYQSVNHLIGSFAAVLMLIIMVGSVSLIYNAFSISVSERTKQFGLLSSVGATRRQIRRCVFTEALFLSAAGIPLGILSGYGGIAVTLHLTHDLIDNLLASAAQNGIILKAVPSLPAFAAAGVVALITVLISAWLPARRATRIDPIAAIRQTQECKVPKHSLRAGRLSRKLLGVPAALARKYYTVNRRKYRATILSLTLSMVLFVVSGSFVQRLNATAQEQANLDNFDFDITVTSQAQLERLRAHPALKDSALVFHEQDAEAFIPPEAFTDDYRAILAATSHGGDISATRIRIEYLEDRVLQDFLSKQGLDPTPYLDPHNPLALVPYVQLTTYQYDETGRPIDRQQHSAAAFRDTAETLPLLPGRLPSGVLERLKHVYDDGLQIEPDGTILLSVRVPQDTEGGTQPDQSYAIEVRPMDGGTRFAYYLRDPATGVPEQNPVDVVPAVRAPLRIGACVQALPMGIARAKELNTITVILPLSAAHHPLESVCLMASTSDYEAFLRFLQEEDLVFADYLKVQMEYRDYITMIRIFSYGFLALISLICICNVFNTISTNIALRKKDFGMLRSVGMKNREINHMMAYECLQYGLHTLLWGIPLSLLASALAGRLTDSVPSTPPIGSLLIAAGCIFTTVFITMFYAVSKLKKQNPMEAIRSEG